MILTEYINNCLKATMYNILDVVVPNKLSVKQASNIYIDKHIVEDKIKDQFVITVNYKLSEEIKDVEKCLKEKLINTTACFELIITNKFIKLTFKSINNRLIGEFNVIKNNISSLNKLKIFNKRLNTIAQIYHKDIYNLLTDNEICDSYIFYFLEKKLPIMRFAQTLNLKNSLPICVDNLDTFDLKKHPTLYIEYCSYLNALYICLKRRVTSERNNWKNNWKTCTIDAPLVQLYLEEVKEIKELKYN